MKIFIISAIITIVIYWLFGHLMDFLCKESEEEKKRIEEQEKNKDVATRRVDEELKSPEVLDISTIVFVSAILTMIGIPVSFVVRYFIG